MINKNKKYSFDIGYTRGVTSTGPVITQGSEVQDIIRQDIERARRYFGTAVAHYEKGFETNTIYVEITARRDKRSALWGRWIIKPY